jgi:tRNA dimethylallyltransferase
MQSSVDKKDLIIILGPTGVGKTEMSLQLAEIFKGEIVSADSRLLYRGMDIGTAKPTKEDLNRIPHHLVDVAYPNEIWSLAKFQDAAYRAINDIQRRKKVPFLVGGTGQYIRAIKEGWEIPRTNPDSHLRAVLNSIAREVGPDKFHKQLSVVDPDAASGIEPQNIRRTIRAFEVIFTTGRSFSAQRKKTRSPYRLLILGIKMPRPDLYQRIDSRLERMLAEGFVEEVQGLLDMGYSPDLPSLSAIGYQQIIQYLHGEITLEEAVVKIKRITRQFVRRQANWFKEEDEDIHWFEACENILQYIVPMIEKFLTINQNPIH